MRYLLFALILTQAAWSRELPSDERILAHTVHTASFESGPLLYTATVGSIPIKDEAGSDGGEIFYIAYRKEGIYDSSERPITFAFNGGPGSSSVWLHLGALGPKRVLQIEEGQKPLPPYYWIDNPDSILDLTDLVFIDPIGTGFSRAAHPEVQTFCTSSDGDIEIISDFIRDYITKEGRWLSPKYLTGESYGTYRACGLAMDLQGRHGLYLNGLILISCAIDFQTLDFSLDNELPYSLFLPTFAATSWYHGRLDQAKSLEKTVEEARFFALNTYATTLSQQGMIPPSLYPELSYWTGLPLTVIQHFDGCIDDMTYFLQFFRSSKKVIGRFDSRKIGNILYPYTPHSYLDPSSTQIEGLFTAAMHAYLNEELNCSIDWPRYAIYSPEVARTWNFDSFGYPNMMENLRTALVINPSLRIFTACGYYDLATPFAAAEYCFKRLRLPYEHNVSFGYYEGGHMFYTNPKALNTFKIDLTKFYTKDN